MSPGIHFEPPSLLPKPDGQAPPPPKAADPLVGWEEVGGGKIQINDIVFDLPPEQIQISQHFANLELPLLRSKENTTLKSGHGEFLVSFPLLFVDRDGTAAWNAINNQLLPLIQQFRKTPFCLVENELIRKAVFPGTYDDARGCRKPAAPNMAFSLVNMTVSTVEDLPGALEARLDLAFFNYFPFSERFSFRRSWAPAAPSDSPSSAEEAAAAVKTYDAQAVEVFNPRESAAWKAFWQYGFDYSERMLTGDLSNDFALEFTFLEAQGERPVSYTARWRAQKLVPVHLSVDFENRIAKLPVLNWVYATHQYLGGMNRTLTVVFQTTGEGGKELEYLQYLVAREQEQTANYRYLSQYWGVKIANDLARLCGIKSVVVEDLTVDSVPGHPEMLQVTLVLREHFLQEERMRPVTQIPNLDHILQQTLERLMRLGQDAGLVYPTAMPQYKLEGVQDDKGRLLNPGHELWADSGETATVWRVAEGKNKADPLVSVFHRSLGRYGDSLTRLLNQRPDMRKALPALPGQNAERNEDERQYHDRLRSFLKAALEGPLKSDGRFADLRAAAFKIEGNHPANICYPDLDLPPHPATGRVADTEPDCYFYNRSDSRPVKLEKVFSRGLEIIENAFSSAKAALSGTGGLGWDLQVTGGKAAAASLPKPTRPSQVGVSKSYQDLIDKYAKKYGLDPDLVAAVIKQESQFNPYAVSPQGAKGLMQLMPETAREMGCQDPFDPEQNIEAGCKYLSKLLSEFNGNLELALAAYNAGPGRVRQYGGIPPFRETQEYVANVKAYYQAYQQGGAGPAPAPAPVFLMPVSGRVTSDFYDGRDNGKRLHFGVDIVAAAGTPVIAPTNLTVTQAGYSSSYGNYIYAQDQYGNTHMFGHLLEQPSLTAGQQVAQGELLGLVGNTGASTDPHLDWKVQGPDGQFLDIGKLMGIKKGDTVTAKASQGPIPMGVEGMPGVALAGYNTEERGFTGWDHPPDNPGGNAPLQSLTLDAQKLGFAGTRDPSYGGQVVQAELMGKTLQPRYHYEQDLGPAGAKEIFSAFANSFRDQTLTMRRAYPAFALYFTDEFRRGMVFLNNAYGWGAVKEIQLIRSRKNPVDTLIVQLSNARGDLFTQQFNDPVSNPMDHVSFSQQVIKEGTDVKLKLGYHNDPEKLETVFTGKITEIEGHNSAVITIVCQSYAIELFQSEYGDNPTATMGWFHADTKEIISTLLVLPECVHLGRWQPGQVVQPGEGGAYAASLGRWFFRFFPNPTDNNVFVPDKGLLASWFQAFTHWGATTRLGNLELSSLWPFTHLHYVPYRQLPWEIIEEMTLRHPGYIAYVVPYEGVGSHKATLFFGVPCQNYYWRAVDGAEAEYLRDQPAWIADPVHAGAYFETPLADAHSMVRRQRMRPFRNYFYLDSEHHLIDNGLVTSARDTYNAVEIEYVLDAREAFGYQSGMPDPSSFYTYSTYKVKANDAIREDYCRWFHSRERNCEGAGWANRYAIGYLYRHLKDLYSGEIVIVGEPGIKPYDAVFLYDSYNDVCGPIEVEQVTHILSQETGFITSIVPDLSVQTNEYASAAVLDALGMYFGALWLGLNAKKARFGSGQANALDLADLPWTGLPEDGEVRVQKSVSEYALSAAGALSTIVPLLQGGLVGVPLSILVSFGGIVLFNWARKQNPIRVTPVLWKGRPFLCGLDGFTLDTAWGHAGNGLRRAFNGFKDFLDHAAATARQLLESNL